MDTEQVLAFTALIAALVTSSIINWRARFSNGALGRIRQRSQARQTEENQGASGASQYIPDPETSHQSIRTSKPSGEFSREDIDAHLVFLDRAHKMTSSDPATQETHYSKSAKIIRDFLAMNGESL